MADPKDSPSTPQQEVFHEHNHRHPEAEQAQYREEQAAEWLHGR
jgi:hypothetical protein